MPALVGQGTVRLVTPWNLSVVAKTSVLAIAASVVLDPVSAGDEELVSIRDTQAYQKQRLVQPLRVRFILAAVDLLALQPNLRKGGVPGWPGCPVTFRIVGSGWGNAQKGIVESGFSALLAHAYELKARLSTA